MPRPKFQPKYQRHKPTGQAITRIGGRAIYLGKYDTPASQGLELVAKRVAWTTEPPRELLSRMPA
jgi:hypothetical protein